MNTMEDFTISDAVRLGICRDISAKVCGDTNAPDELLARIGVLLESTGALVTEREMEAEESLRIFHEGKSHLVADGEATLRELEASLSQVAKCLQLTGPFLGNVDAEKLVEAEKTLEQVRSVEQKVGYLKWLDLIHEQSDRIRSSLSCDSTSDAMAFLQTLVDWCGSFHRSNCSKLKAYLFDVTIYWTNLVGDHIARDLPGMLNNIGFPRPPSSRKLDTITVDARLRSDISDVVLLLLRLRLPGYIKPSTPSLEVPFLHDLLPLKYFILPLEKRFRFHFFISDKTNRLDKPEWYFTQLLSWIRDYGDFMENLLQPIYRADGQRSVRTDFAMSLVWLGRAKFLSSLPALLEDDTLFTHAVDELLTFARNLKQLGHATVQEAFCHVLLSLEVFHRWFQMEKSLAGDWMDTFLTSSTAWRCQYEEGTQSPEHLKVPESVQQFLTMIKAITERYELLPSIQKQQDFLSFQLDCIEDINERLKTHYEQHQDDTESCARQILPTLATATKFLGDSLEEMASTPLMVQLLTVQESRTASSPPETAKRAKLLALRISNVVEECNRLARESYLSHLRSDTLDAIRGLIREFTKQGWKSMPSVTEFLVPSMTPAMGELLFTMKTIVASQRERLLVVLFTRHIVGLMDALDRIFFDEVILSNAFSTGGAAQVKYDIVSNFAVSLNRMTQLPNAGLARTAEACQILTMNRGSAMLLAELFVPGQKMDKKTQSDDIKNALKEMNVTLLQPEEVALILRRRSDLDAV